MKKTLSIILAVLLVFSMTLSFTACGGEKATEKDTVDEVIETTEEISETEPQLDPKEEGEKVVDAFLGSFFKFDFENALKAVNGGEDVTGIPYSNLDDAKNQLVEAMTAGQFEQGSKTYQAIEDFTEAMLNLVCDGFEYEIKDVKENGNKFEYTVDVKSYSMTALQNSVSELDPNAIMEDLLNSGKITADMTEDELLETVMVEVFKIATDVIDESTKNAEKTSAEINLTVEEIDGNWLITDGDIDKLASIMA